MADAAGSDTESVGTAPAPRPAAVINTAPVIQKLNEAALAMAIGGVNDFAVEATLYAMAGIIHPAATSAAAIACALTKSPSAAS